MACEYQIIANQYVLHDKGQAVGRSLDIVAIAFDKETGELHQHGEPARVQTWLSLTVKRLANSGQMDNADKLVSITGKLPLIPLNRCLNNPGYCKEFYTRVLNDEFAYPSTTFNPSG